MAEIKQIIVDNVDHVIHENGNAYISLRKVKWNEDAEPKLDLRRYITRSDGTEQIMKGCAFDDKAADELANALIEEGYGDTRTCLEAMRTREDFMPSLSWCLEDGDKSRLQSIFPELALPEVEDNSEDYVDIREELGL